MLAFLSDSSWAQTIGPGQTKGNVGYVSQTGSNIRFGRIEIHPAIKVEGRLNDNIFLEADKKFDDGTSEGVSEDFIRDVKPSVKFQKVRRKGEFLGFDINYQLTKQTFTNLSSENKLLHDVKGSMQFAGPGDRLKLTTKGRWFDTISPASSEFGSNFNPRARRIDANIGADLDFDITARLSLNLNSNFRSNTFKEVAIKGENKQVTFVGGGVFWKVTPLTAVGVKYQFRAINYTRPGTINLDSETNSIYGVIKFAPTAFISGEIGAGFDGRNYKARTPADRVTNPDRDAARYDVNLNYHLSDRTSFVLTGNRGVKDSTFANIQAYLATSAKLLWHQKWGRKFSSQIGGGYQNQDYSIATADSRNFGALKKRNDDRYTAEFSLTYAIQKWLKATLQYNYKENVSNFDDRDYRNNTLGLSLNAVF
ncbi:MAG: outer membrane beta-barrel protein [Nitrospinales bacterium]